MQVKHMLQTSIIYVTSYVNCYVKMACQDKPLTSTSGKRQKPANKEANGRCNLFLSYPLLCHPKLSKKYRERKVVRWIAVLASTLGTNCNDASNNSREIRQKGHHVGTFRLLRDGFKCFKLKNSIPNPNYSVVC